MRNQNNFNKLGRNIKKTPFVFIYKTKFFITVHIVVAYLKHLVKS